MRLADRHFDFTGHDILLVVMPSSHFCLANAQGSVRTAELGHWSMPQIVSRSG